MSRNSIRALQMKWRLLLLITSGLWAVSAYAGPSLQLRLVPIEQGVAEDDRAPEPEIVATAREAGVNLRRCKHPLLSHSYQNGQLFYVFYKTVDQAQGPLEYLLQRIRKVERFYRSADDTAPTTRETFLVEAFKLRDGSLKRADEHFGCFGIGRYHRREIVKEYEIGFGEIEGVASGKAWPFRRNVLYEAIQKYGPDRTLYDRVKFTQAKSWNLEVSFDRNGSYSVRSPELGFNAPDMLPTVPRMVSQK